MNKQNPQQKPHKTWKKQNPQITTYTSKVRYKIFLPQRRYSSHLFGRVYSPMLSGIFETLVISFRKVNLLSATGVIKTLHNNLTGFFFKMKHCSSVTSSIAGCPMRSIHSYLLFITSNNWTIAKWLKICSYIYFASFFYVVVVIRKSYLALKIGISLYAESIPSKPQGHPKRDFA